MKGLKIGILGTRGIPNRYGGFEQMAQYLSEALVKKHCTVTVYCSHRHPYKQKEYNGTQLAHCYDPEYLIGTAGQFVYDYNCLRHAQKQQYDILLCLGYTSSSVWHRFFSVNTALIYNMDGLEWKRSKYSRLTQQFLKYAEKLAVKHADVLVADSAEIQKYITDTYHTPSVFIAYGAELHQTFSAAHLKSFNLPYKDYFLLIARMEPENNIEMILDGFVMSKTDKQLLVIGSIDNRFGKVLKKKFSPFSNIIFAGALYDAEVLYSLRASSLAYFHGHSVGGTNPSLLEAMAAKCLILAHSIGKRCLLF
jgi:glycosyltransferase involved in cell wall biosynthesis